MNARTSILAAANPIGGRYDRTKSLAKNITLTLPLMSRFDLFFILVDECNEVRGSPLLICQFVEFNYWLTDLETVLLFQVTDYAIARRIIDLHSNVEELLHRVYTLEEILRYITFARQFKPKVIYLP